MSRKIVADNRRARHEYFIEDKIEAGLVLTGSEVKSLRQGRCSLGDAYAAEQGGEMYLLNAHIPEYKAANRFNHEPLRPRKLLLHKREMARLIGQIQRQGITLVALSVYFNEKGVAKVELGVARGKKKHDKRATEKERSWQREKARVMRERG